MDPRQLGMHGSQSSDRDRTIAREDIVGLAARTIGRGVRPSRPYGLMTGPSKEREWGVRGICRSIVLLSAVLAGLFAGLCNAAGLQPSIRFDRLSEEDGLPHYLVTSITQDAKGFMWFATVDGLARWDGYQSTVYRHDRDNPNTIASNEIHDLIVDRTGALWIATNSGVDRFDPGTEAVIHYRHDPDDTNTIDSDFVVSIAEDGDGILWLGTLTGLNRFDHSSGSVTRFQHDPDDRRSLPGGPVRALYFDRNDALWVGTFTSDGTADLAQFNQEDSSFDRMFSCSPGSGICPQPESESDRLVTAKVAGIYEDSAGALWIGSDGLIRIDEGRSSYRRFTSTEDDQGVITGLVGNSPSGQVIEDELGGLWIGDDRKGLTRLDLDANEFSHFRHDPGDATSLGSDTIFELFRDRDGNIWIATYEAGVSRFDPLNFQFGHLKHDARNTDSPSPSQVDHVAQGNDGVLWVATDNAGLDRVDRERRTVRHYRHDPDDPTSLSHDGLNTVHIARDGMVWVGSRRGLDRFDPTSDQFESIPLHDADKPGDQVAILSIAQDANGWLWLAARTALIHLDPESLAQKRFDTNSNDPRALHGERLDLHIANDGILWISTMNEGVNRFDPATQSVTHYKHDADDPNSISAGYVRHPYEDVNGILWFPTGSGLSRLDPETGDFQVYGREHGLPSDNVISVAEDEFGHLWIGTANGVARVDPETMSTTVFGIKDGLQSTDNDCRRLAHTDEMTCWGVGGINIFSPSRLLERQSRPSAVFTDLRIFNEVVPVGNDPDSGVLSRRISTTPDLTLSHEKYLFSLEFSALDFRDPGAIRYAYRLDGFDSDWIMASAANRRATYTRVPAGRYTLRVKAARDTGSWGEESSLNLTVTPPFWNTWWAYLVYATVGFLSLWTFVAMRTRAARKRAEALEVTVHERTAEIDANRRTIAKQARRLEDLLNTKNRLFEDLSHEFRTPLTLIAGPVSDVSQRVEDRHTHAAINVAKRSINRLSRLVDQLLDLARVQAGQPVSREPQPLGAIVESQITAFQPLASDRQISLRAGNLDNLWVSCGADALEKILANLMSNAIKFTPAGGSITVSVFGVEDDIVCFQVTDTGVGIPIEAQSSIFDRFDRGTQKGEHIPGTGIGLSLVKQLTEACGGRVDLDSSPETGTSVSVFLPAAETQRERRPSYASGPAIRQELESLASVEAFEVAKNECPDAPIVLIIEDNEELRNYLGGVLQRDCSVLRAPDGESGLTLATESLPDLLVCDVMLPGISGFEVCKALKADPRTAHIPVLMLTARADDLSRLHAYECHVDDFLTKPFSNDELRLRIANLLESRALLRERYGRTLFLDSGDEVELADADQNFVNKLDAILAAHFADPDFKPPDLADLMAMSLRQLQRKMKAVTDHSPGDYIRNFRLAKARTRVDAGEPIGRVALDTGFSSQSYFAKCFKSLYGRSPSEERKSRPV